MSTHVWFTRTQWAVGQGFFHSGEVQALGANVLYVYDCGSLDDDALNREIDEFLVRHENQQIDMLFVSHYHYDHVSGLPRLLSEANVKSVIIPVIEPIERLAALGATLPQDELDSWAVDFAADPEGALRGLDPKINVVFVEPSEDDTDDRGADDGGELPKVEIGEEGAEDLDEPSRVRLKVGGTSTLRGDDLKGNTVALWIWKAYTTTFARRRHKALLKHLEKQPGLNAASIKNALNSALLFRQFVQTHHKEITAAFAQTFPDVNLSSLLLYSGPATERKYRGRRYRTRSAHAEGKEIGAWDILPGWLGTGDQNMGVRRCNEVATVFSEELWRVGVFALPHHGAKSSYHSRLLEMFPGEKPTCVVSAGVHSQYGHPFREVLMDVSAQGGSIVLVNEAMPSRSTESGRLDF